MHVLHSIEENAYWSEHVYSHVMRLLNEYGVNLEAILLKPNMCLPGAAWHPLPSASPSFTQELRLVACAPGHVAILSRTQSPWTVLCGFAPSGRPWQAARPV